jgi:nucleotide-binding universal stress UspA family protein
MPAPHEPTVRLFRRLVVCTDFSPAAELAVAQAFRLAGAAGAAVTLVHVVDGESVELYPGDLRKLVDRCLDDLVARLAPAGLDVDRACVAGHPWDAIVAHAVSAGADLVVIGTRGRSSYARIRVGSTTDRVVRLSEVPVLAVPPADEGGHDRPLRRALVADDFSGEARSAVETAASPLAAETGETIELVLLHVCAPPVVYGADGVSVATAEAMSELEAGAREGLESLAARLRSPRLAVEAVVGHGAPADTIIDEARRRAVDLVAVGTRGRSGLAHLLLGSVAERVLHHAGCPVLVVRQTPAGR